MLIPSTPVRRALAAALVAAVAAFALAACGSSSSSSKSSSSAASAGAAGGATQNAKFASCLKQHGVTLPRRRGGQRPPGSGQGGPPPGGSANGARRGGGGFLFGGGAGANSAQAKKARAAMQACRKDLPNGGRFRGGGRAGSHFSAATLKTFTACVKRHGYTLPKANTSGKGAVFPRSIESKPAFQKAARACASTLRPSGGAPGAASG